MVLPLGAMLSRAGVFVALIVVVGGGIASIFSIQAAIGVAIGSAASLIASVIGLFAISPTKPRPIISWPFLLFAAQGISLFLAVTITLALVYSATQLGKAVALPSAAVVFIIVWFVFAKAFGAASGGSQSDR